MPRTAKAETKLTENSQETAKAEQKTSIIDQQSTAIALIASRAEAETVRIAEHLALVEARINTAQQELDAIAPTRAARAEHLNVAQRQVTTLASTHTEAATYAKFADGNHDAIKAVSTAAKDLDQARQELAQIAREAELTERDAQQREQELTALLAQLREEHDIHQADLRNVEVARDRAFNELGQERYTAFYAEYEQKQTHTDDLRSQLVAAEVELAELIDAALEALRPWPDQAHKVRQIQGYQDATTRTIDAAISYIDTLLKERINLKQDLPGLEATKNTYYWWEALSVPSNELYGHAQHLKANVSYLEDRLRKLKQIEQEYTTQMLG